MKLKEILKGIEISDTKNVNEDIEIRDVVFNSKNADKDSLFVAIKGYVTDGHKYISNAFEKGASVAIVEEFNGDFPQIKVKNSRIALAKSSCNFFKNPSKNFDLVGITATNGKTSVSMMCNSIIKSAGKENGLLGTVYYKAGKYTESAILTTPESRDLQEWFYKISEQKIPYTVMEVSSSALEMERVYGADFDVVSMNNISREHIDQHKSFENYFNCKKKLITKAKETAVAILNTDDDYVASLKTQTKASVLTLGVKAKDVDLTAENIDMSTGFPTFDIIIKKDLELRGFSVKKSKIKVNLKVGGYHSVLNALSATGICLALGISLEDIKNGLEDYNGIERRFEIIYNDDFKIIDDHFANSGNIAVSLKSLKGMDYNDLHMVYAIRGNRGVTVNRENILEIAKWKDIKFKSFIITDYSDMKTHHDTVSDAERETVYRSMEEENIEYEVCHSLEEAIKLAIDRAKPNDLVFLAGSQGMDFGGKTALEYLADKKPKKREEILKPLKNRIAGTN